MQILATYGHENKKIKGLDIIGGDIVQPNKQVRIKIPHMGWNKVHQSKNHPMCLSEDKHFYFVHSFYFKSVEKKYITATTKYHHNFPSIVNKDNIYGVQFHPEKSHLAGMNIIKNFIFKA